METLPIPPSAVEALTAVHRNSKEYMMKADIDKLLKGNYITAKHGGGWMTTSKGRELLRELKIKHK